MRTIILRIETSSRLREVLGIHRDSAEWLEYDRHFIEHETLGKIENISGRYAELRKKAKAGADPA